MHLQQRPERSRMKHGLASQRSGEGEGAGTQFGRICETLQTLQTQTLQQHLDHQTSSNIWTCPCLFSASVEAEEPFEGLGLPPVFYET